MLKCPVVTESVATPPALTLVIVRLVTLKTRARVRMITSVLMNLVLIRRGALTLKVSDKVNITHSI